MLDPADLGRLLLADHDTASLLQAVAALAVEQVPGAVEASVTLLADGRAPATVAAVGERAVRLDETQYAEGFGPCLDAAASGQVHAVPDMAQEQRYPQFAAVALATGLRCSASVPVPVPGEVQAALNIYGETARVLDEAAVQVAVGLAAYAGVTIANMRVYEQAVRTVDQLHEAMRSRAVIEQAKGVLIAQHRCGPDEAFALLRDRSSHSNVKLREVAQAVVDEAAGAPAGDGPAGD